MTGNVILWILLYMISTSSQIDGIVVDEETLQNLLNRRIILPTDEYVPLGVYYGSEVNIHNFNPGVGMLQLLMEYPNEDIPILLSHIEDDEMGFSFNVEFDHIDRAVEAIAGNNLVLIKGDPQTGKTRTLRIIELELLNQRERVLAIYVDLRRLLNSDTLRISNSDGLFRELLPLETADLVKNVADVNPSKVKILMDNIDSISLAHREQIIIAISELQSRRISVVVSSTTNVAPFFTQRQMDPTVLDIPIVSEREFETTCDNYWSHMMDEEFQERHSERIRQYSKALQLMVFETPLPRSIGLLRQLLNRAASHGFQPFPSLQEFVNNPEMYPNPRFILRLSDNMRVDKATLYTQILPEPSVAVSEFEVYGIQALKMLLKPSETPTISAELGHRIDWSNTKISQHGAKAYKLMTFENGAPVDFLHPEYKRYYSGLYISNSFAAGTPLIESFKTIVHDPQHSIVAEFINSGMLHFDHSPQVERIFSRLITTVPDVAFQISDNLISHRLDILSSKMLKALGQAQYLTEYINNPTITLKSKNKYSFGMLSEVQNVDKYYHIPRKTPWMYSGNRIEMIVNLELTSSLQTLRDYGYRVDPNTELISAARRPHRLAELLNANREQNYPMEVLNKAMYESIKALGPESIQNMRALKARGARPAKIDIEGRTLAHEAARWHSRELLEVIHEEFRVSLFDTPDKSGQTILFELLDHALPSNAYLQENAWESISYLTEHGDLYVNEEIIKRSIDSFKSYAPPVDDVYLSYKSLVAYDEEAVISKLDVIDTLKWFIPIEDVDIPREILSMRRLLITKNCIKTMIDKSINLQVFQWQDQAPDFVTVAELVFSHKAISGDFQFHHYQNAMKYLLTKKVLSFNPFQLERVSNIIVKSMYIAADFIKITQMMRNDVIQVEPRILGSIKTAYDLRIEERLPQIDINGDFETRAMESVYGLHPDILYNDAMAEVAAIMENFNYGEDYARHDPDFDIYFCVI